MFALVNKSGFEFGGDETMRGIRIAVLASAFALGASQAGAAPTVFNFGALDATELPSSTVVPANASDTVLTQHVSFTVSGATIDAFALSAASGEADVTRRPGDGVDESGLGVKSGSDASSGTLVEVSVSEQIVLDVSAILSDGYTIQSVLLGSLQSGEYADIFGTDTLPSGYVANLANLTPPELTADGLFNISSLVTGDSGEQANFDLSGYQYKYYIFTADVNGGNNDGIDSSDNLLINSLTVSPPPITEGCTPGIPCPEPITLSLFGAGLAGAVGLRRKKKTNGSSLAGA